MMNKALWLLIWLSMEFDNPSVRAFLISGWWTQILSHIAVVLPRTSYKHQRWTRSASSYSQACQDRRASFTSICVLVDGLLGKETDFFLHHLHEFLCAK